jgi:hypothetical protein
MNQWFYRPAAPNLTAAWQGNDVVITQPAPYFDLEVPVWVLDGSDWITRSVHLTGASAKISFPEAAGKPFLVDPEVWLMTDITYQQNLSLEERLALYTNAPHAGSKARVMDQFLRGRTPDEALQIARSITQAPLLVRYMGEIRPNSGGESEQFLVHLLGNPDKRVANQAADRLSAFPNASASTLGELRRIYRQDPNPLMMQTAFRTLLRLTNDEAMANDGWRIPSYNEGFRLTVLDWWADKHPNLARTRALEVVAKPLSEPLRVSAIRHLGQLKDAPGEKRVFNALLTLLKEDSFGARNTAISALADYGDKAALPALRPFLKHPLVFFRQTAEGAVQRLQGST